MAFTTTGITATVMRRRSRRARRRRPCRRAGAGAHDGEEHLADPVGLLDRDPARDLDHEHQQDQVEHEREARHGREPVAVVGGDLLQSGGRRGEDAAIAPESSPASRRSRQCGRRERLAGHRRACRSCPRTMTTGSSARTTATSTSLSSTSLRARHERDLPEADSASRSRDAEATRFEASARHACTTATS